MRIAVGMLRVQAYPLQHTDDSLLALLLIGSQLVNVDGFAYNVGNRHTGIQAGIRILEYNLHLSAVGKHVDLRLMAELNLALLV